MDQATWDYNVAQAQEQLRICEQGAAAMRQLADTQEAALGQLRSTLYALASGGPPVPVEPPTEPPPSPASASPGTTTPESASSSTRSSSGSGTGSSGSSSTGSRGRSGGE